MSYLSNLPPEIQEKVERLAECQRQIANLESQLMQIKNESNHLEEELLGYRDEKHIKRPDARKSQVVVAVRPINIQKLPNEMLLRIFEYFLSENHRLIRCLLLVCKHWNRTVMQSPRLWARIQLSPSDYEEYRYSPKSLIQYVEVCIQRSQSVLLDIELDYNSLRTREVYIRDTVFEAISDIFDDYPNVLNQVANLDCDFASPEYDKYFDQNMKELSTLFGPMGAHMKRWRSLHLRVPWRDCILALDILQMMCGVAPNLQSISLSQIGYVLDVLCQEWFEGETPLLAFPSPRSLKLDDSKAAHLLEDIVRTPSTLMHLDICYDSRLNDISELQAFTTLRSLTLRISAGVKRLSVPKNENLSISLPELHELSLWGDSLPLKAVQFDLPNLQRLQLNDGAAIQLPMNISPKYIQWSAGDIRQTPDVIQPTLAAILQSSSRATVISIFKISREIYEIVLEELHKAPELPVSLETIVLDLTGGERVHIDVATLRS
ncbi:hypothetical protein M408DRAFT_21287 [Serendipita vermifera MAFF 305830]|uniref:F-box domain-containing protein n=1 Tax=Serendipita vermifera MAFF 305830 TaxID=933852 RepID=A0A0C2WYR0_SERVB|nr:hypothetical protein M408DRAFT_21287 [Serendipita vermifera MAFF 305830]